MKVALSLAFVTGAAAFSQVRTHLCHEWCGTKRVGRIEAVELICREYRCIYEESYWASHLVIAQIDWLDLVLTVESLSFSTGIPPWGPCRNCRCRCCFGPCCCQRRCRRIPTILCLRSHRRRWCLLWGCRLRKWSIYQGLLSLLRLRRSRWSFSIQTR